MDINKAIYKITQSVLTMSVTKSFHKKKCQLQKVEFTTAKKKKNGIHQYISKRCRMKVMLGVSFLGHDKKYFNSYNLFVLNKYINK